jgi:hypothetical protein
VCTHTYIQDFEAIGYEPPPPGTFHQHWLRAPEGRRVTVVITSCGRLPGLRRTVNSLLASNTYPVDQYLIIDDSGNVDFAAKLIEEFGDVFDILVNRQRMGQLFSIDKAYSVVKSEYIFHCEDDWVCVCVWLCPYVYTHVRILLLLLKSETLNPKP